jgi:hypothetical protein
MQRWFLSYHSPDQALAERLKAAIERRDAESRVFFAPINLRAGGFWSAQLAQEIADATAFVLLVGQHGLGHWQVPEYGEALDRWVKSDFPIVLMLLEGQTAPGLPFLRQLHWIVSSDPTSEKDVARLFDAGTGSGTRPGELWRYTAPYRGLAAMAEADSDFFFGRAKETVQVLKALEKEPDKLVMLFGNSGVGKSSLAQAGVLAALVRQAWPQGTESRWPRAFNEGRRWCVLSLRPGRQPLKTLVDTFLRTWQYDPTDARWEERVAEWVEALLNEKATLGGLLDATERRYQSLGQPPPAAFFLYIDQGEELYVRAEGQQRRRFSQILAHGIADARLRAMMSIRSDFLGALQNDEPLFNSHVKVDVPPLREAELREVVNRPAALLSARFDSENLALDIARRTAEESTRDAGALPLLSYLLDDMWKQMVKRGDGVLRLSAPAIDLGGALVERANDFLAGNPGAEDRLRRIMTLKLATVREDGEPIRRRALRSEFSDAEDWRLVNELADNPYRLLVTATPEGYETYAEIAHEAVFRRWEKLREWIAAEGEFLVWRARLTADRRRWEEAPLSSKDAALLMGLALAQAQSWWAKRQEDLSRADREFIESSMNREAREQAQARAERDQALSMQSRFLADAARQCIARRDYTTAIALALEALPDERRGVDRPYVAVAESMLYQSLIKLHEHHSRLGGRKVGAVVFGDDGGSRAAHRSKAQSIFNRRDRLTLKSLEAAGAFEEAISFATFSPDNRQVLSCANKTAWVWDADTGKLTASLLHSDKIIKSAFSPDGSCIVTTCNDGPVRLWDPHSGTVIVTLASGEKVRAAAFSPDSTQIFTGSVDGTLRLWDRRTAKLVWSTARPSEQASAAETIVCSEFSPDGRAIATAFDSCVEIWDANTGARLSILSGHTKVVGGIAFSQDGRLLATTSADWTARIWSTEHGDELFVLRARESWQSINTAAFSQNSRRLAIGGGDMTACIWDIATGTMNNVMRGHQGAINTVAFSSDGRRLLTGSADNTSRIWDTESGAEIAVMQGYAASFSSDNHRVVTANRYNAQVYPVFATPQELIDRARAIEQTLETSFVLTPSQRTSFFLSS